MEEIAEKVCPVQWAQVWAAWCHYRRLISGLGTGGSPPPPARQHRWYWTPGVLHGIHSTPANPHSRPTFAGSNCVAPGYAQMAQTWPLAGPVAGTNLGRARAGIGLAEHVETVGGSMGPLGCEARAALGFRSGCQTKQVNRAAMQRMSVVGLRVNWSQKPLKWMAL